MGSIEPHRTLQYILMFAFVCVKSVTLHRRSQGVGVAGMPQLLTILCFCVLAGSYACVVLLQM